MHVLHVVGARPNFMKVAPVLHALRARTRVRQTLVHTGQHYDARMSDSFFTQLAIPEPDVNLAVGSGSHAWQTAEIMTRFEPLLLERRPDIVLVYGDVNSTIAAALVCAKLGITVGHVEAGLRSFDRTMPEEINRIVTDQLSDLLFTPSLDGNENLSREGVSASKVHFVGNVMIDTLVRLLPAAKSCRLADMPDRFALVTLHRPSNVDEPAQLRRLIEALLEITQEMDVVFPVHPRTRTRLAEFGLTHTEASGLHLLEPLPYLEFLSLQNQATVVITDSGGIQEETTALGVPCLTLRSNTERPVTITMGTNILVGDDPGRLKAELDRILSDGRSPRPLPPLWDGHAGERIADVLVNAGEPIAAAQDRNAVFADIKPVPLQAREQLLGTER